MGAHTHTYIYAYIYTYIYYISMHILRLIYIYIAGSSIHVYNAGGSGPKASNLLTSSSSSYVAPLHFHPISFFFCGDTNSTYFLSVQKEQRHLSLFASP